MKHPRWINFLLTQISAFDPELFDHSVRVSNRLERLVRLLKFDKTTRRTLRLAGLVHDVGKTRLPKRLFNKTRLTATEFNTIRRHPRLGYLIIKPHNRSVARIIVGHHENTRNYPRGGGERRTGERGSDRRLQSDGTSYLTQLLSLVDTHDALSHPRAYKSGWSKRQVLAELSHLFPTLSQEILLLEKRR